jgi:hypothetical protein
MSGLSPRPEVPQQIGVTMRSIRPRRTLFNPSVIAGALHPESKGIPKTTFGRFYKIASLGHDRAEIRTDLVLWMCITGHGECAA